MVSTAHTHGDNARHTVSTTCAYINTLLMYYMCTFDACSVTLGLRMRHTESWVEVESDDVGAGELRKHGLTFIASL